MATYEQILTAMQEEYYQRTGFYADDASDIGIRLKVLATQLSLLDNRLDDLKKQVFPQTAAGTPLDYHAETRGLLRKAATASLGMLRFSRETPAPADIIVPAGVICSVGRNEAEPNLRFETTAQGVLVAGSTFVDIAAQSADGGALTNVAPGAINVMITP
ncbi:baseplate J/gp47 family protein, partial [Hydrogenoanaerobacterium sp.]|uniref:baseplate J/gp47 family protein n=1 Tax=Hydrogenoanaerobacterium sp. TaxID=2953763 RepID=UPI0028982930